MSSGRVFKKSVEVKIEFIQCNVCGGDLRSDISMNQDGSFKVWIDPCKKCKGGQ